ncbi:MAG TPA: glycosyltransferase [Gemmatimonadaceae bacterium]|nr:glycosyltransferase [Gemmatimonadaceae bacterium]
MNATGAPRLISVVIPVHQGAPELRRCLDAIAESDVPREQMEIVVVDDASTDASAVIAGQYADTVIRLSGRPRGPAYVRNRGVELARGDVVVTVDADVCVHRDAIRRMVERLDADPAVGAVVGTYDTMDVGRSIVSDHRNLYQAYRRLRAEGDVDAYWPACGAVRREVLTEVGPFDEWHYWRPQAEGAEFGRRIRRAGHRIVLDPRIQGTHLKSWTLIGTLRTDFANHALPWARLLFHAGDLARVRTPSFGWREKTNAMLTVLTVFVLALRVRWPSTGMTAFVASCIVAMLVGYGSFLRFALRHRGVFRAALFVPLQVARYLVAVMAIIVGWLLHHLVGEPRRDVRDDALAEVGLQTWPPVPTRLPSDSWHLPPGGRLADSISHITAARS